MSGPHAIAAGIVFDGETVRDDAAVLVEHDGQAALLPLQRLEQQQQVHALGHEGGELDGLGEIRPEVVHHTGLGVGAGDAEVQCRRLLDAVHPPPARGQEVVDEEDVEPAVVGGGEGHVEERVAQHLQLGHGFDRIP